MFFSARHSWLDALYARSYGMSMGEVHLPKLDLYMVNEPKFVKRVMETEAAQFPKSDLLGEALRPLLGDSIFTTSGSVWQRQRSMMDPAFAQARLTVAFPVMRSAVDAMLQRLTHLPANAEHDIEIEMTHVTADIIFRTIFSEPMEGADAKRIFREFARFQAIAPRLMLPALFGIKWLKWPLDGWRSRRAARVIRALLSKFIEPRCRAHKAGEPCLQEDILSALLNAKDADTQTPFSLVELVDQVAMLFLAGHETSASALTWAAYLLANSPDVQSRVCDEVQTQLQGLTPELTDMRRLELVRNVFKETLRLYPPVGFIARQAEGSCPMGKKDIAANSTVVVSPWLIQRHTKHWSAPDEFNPDRYANDASRESLKKAYLPFGMGPRVCMGAAFALQEGALILAMLVRDYQLLPVPGLEPQPVGRLTIRSANGVRLMLVRRSARA
jgi:cytochrome P450